MRIFARIPRRLATQRASGDRFRRGFSTSSKQEKKRETYGTFIEEWRKYRFPAVLGFSCLALLQARRIYWREEDPLRRRNSFQPPVDEEIDFGSDWNEYALAIVETCIPYRWISRVWGKIAATELPYNWMKDGIYGMWTHVYSCNLSEAKYPLTHYKSLSEFFLRPLKEDTRRIDADTKRTIVSPVDGRVLFAGSADIADAPNVYVEQVKGVKYLLSDFVGPDPSGLDAEGKEGRKLQTIVLYLAPGDYHHFHSPTDWKVKQRRHFPGTLLPVRPWAVKQIPGLYCINERVILNGEWEGGFFSFGAVGALNVGSIGISFDDLLLTNQDSWFPFQKSKVKMAQRDFPIDYNAIRGQHIGHFNLGSTIVLVFESSADFTFDVRPGQVVRVGQRIGMDDPTSKKRPLVSAPPWPGSDAAMLFKQELKRLDKPE